VDDRSEKAIAALLQQVQPYARALVKKAAQHGITIKVIGGLRTYEEQNELFAQGRTKPGRIVTNARGGYSNHNFGIAFESSPGPTQLKVQITTDPNFITGVTTLLAGTADATTDYTVKTNIGNLHSASVYYYRFQTLDASVTSNIGKFKTVPDAKAKVAVHFAVSGDCDGLTALRAREPSAREESRFFHVRWGHRIRNLREHWIARCHQHGKHSGSDGDGADRNRFAVV
jgi:hypothetical protein